METSPPVKKQRKKKTKRDDDVGERRDKKQRLDQPSVTTTTEEETQWQKMMKNENHHNATTKASPKKKKKKNTLEKHREHCSMMINTSLAKKISTEISQHETVDTHNHEQRALAIHVMPARERQTTETLALTPSATSNHHVFNDLDFVAAMKKDHYERHQLINTTATRPLEHLMEDGGFMAVDQPHIEPIFLALSKEMRQNINFIKATKNDATSKRKKRLVEGEEAEDGENKQTPTVKKLKLIFGDTYHSFGYHKRTPQSQNKRIEALDQVDRYERFKECFRDDELEEDTNFGEVPRNYKMFRELWAKNIDKYKRRHETLRDAATLVPKIALEEVTKEYIRKFREPPGKHDELCSNGEECVFYTFSDDKNVKYIGKVFYTENERRRRLEAQLNDKEDDTSHNKHKLCIDCLLRLWTKIYFRNIADEVLPERPINYFTVACGRGQYSPNVMLNVTENKKPTGIMGHVPRFAMNKRCIITLEANVYDAGKYHSVFVPCLAETGMDF